MKLDKNNKPFLTEREVRKQVKFVIFARLPSYHELNKGKTWQVKHSIKAKYQHTFFYAIKEGIKLSGFRYIGNTSYFKGKVLVSLTVFGKWRRPPDQDNYILPAGKLIVDHLFSTATRHAAVNLLPDDRFVEYSKVKFKQGKPKVEITIEEIK